MKELGILHIADLHFGYDGDKRPKKPLISEGLRSQLSGDDPREIFLTNVKDLLGSQKVDVLAFTGDAGIGQDSVAMRTGINYLWRIKERLDLSADRVIIAPGNHDLNRKADVQQELSEFFSECRAKNFITPDRQQAAQIIVNDIPIIAINTCLGGTEVALYVVLPEERDKLRLLINKFINISKEDTGIPKELESQLHEMDIPAVGKSQLESIQAHLRSSQGNFAVVLGHHMLLPTRMLIVRPYAEIVDAGQLLYSLIGGERRILYLHGHAHCDSAVVARAPDETESGFVACLGGNGLHKIFASGENASASYIQVLLDDKSNFLVAIVRRFQQRGMSFTKSSFSIWDEGEKILNPLGNIDNILPGRSYSLATIAHLLSVENSDELAIEVLKRKCVGQFDVTDFDKAPDRWTISRNA